MSKIQVYISLLIFFSILSCQKSATNEKKVEEIRLGRELSPSEIIRNPLGEQGLDTSQVAVIKFLETEISFGRIKEGEIVEKSYQFSNSGDVPLYILDVYGTCGCTVPEWPKEAIAPGKTGSIRVSYDTKRAGAINKNVTLTIQDASKEKTGTKMLYIKGNVEPDPNAPAPGTPGGAPVKEQGGAPNN
jgi:hypothetical protein